MNKKIKLITVLLTLNLASCAVLVKESDVQDYGSSLKTAKETVAATKYKDVKIKNIAIFGFSSNLFAGDNSSQSIGGVNAGFVNTITDAASERGCVALDKTYDVALKIFRDYGFSVLDQKQISSNKIYQSVGMKDFPGLCTSGDTRINVLPPDKEMNKLIDELKVDALVTFNINAQNDQSNGGNIYVWTKGAEKAQLSWYAVLGRTIKIESDTNMFFRDLQELSRTSSQKIAITAGVYTTAFRLLAAKMADDLKSN